jgi:hypothetical protein
LVHRNLAGLVSLNRDAYTYLFETFAERLPYRRTLVFSEQFGDFVEFILVLVGYARLSRSLFTLCYNVD